MSPFYPEDPALPGPGLEEYADHAREAAAELLRGYAPAWRSSLADCLPYALEATEGDQLRRARVVAAAHLLKLGGLP